MLIVYQKFALGSTNVQFIYDKLILVEMRGGEETCYSIHLCVV